MTDNAVSFVVYIPMKPSAKVHGRELLMAVVDAMSREPDFVNTWVHELHDDPNVVVLYETWACTKEFFLEHHLKKHYRQAYEMALSDILAGERRLVFLTPLAGYPQRQA